MLCNSAAYAVMRCPSVRLSRSWILSKQINISSKNFSSSANHTILVFLYLEQVANLLCAQANSASYPHRDGKWVVATATGEGLVWLIGAMLCLLAAPWVQLSVNAGNGWPHNAYGNQLPLPRFNAGLWLRHSRQMPRAYDVEGAYERWLQNMLNRR